MDAMLLLTIIAIPTMLIMAIKKDRLARQMPGFWLRNGAIVPRLESLQAYEELIGHYRDNPIYQRIIFQNHCYEFERVALQKDRDLVPDGALLLLPDLLYRIRPQVLCHAA